MHRAATSCEGFVLTGGQSSRMGRDKALLPFGGRPLAVWIAERVKEVCGAVTLVGSRVKYSGLGLPVVEDTFSGQGPLAGIHSALLHSIARFNLVVGCDMPYLSTAFLKRLLEIAQSGEADVVVPESEAFGYEPLCAVYTGACLAAMEEALQAGQGPPSRQNKISRVFARLRVRAVGPQEWLPYDPSGTLFRNVNTPEDYERAQAELLGGH